jgi:hypothetical protein
MYNWTGGFFGPDGRRFLTREEYDVGYDEATLWDAETGKPIKRFFRVYDEPSDRLFARHRAGQAVVAWDVSTGRIRERYYLVNDGDDLLVELPLTGQFLGSPGAQTKVITVGTNHRDKMSRTGVALCKAMR